MQHYDYLFVGAGLFSATIAHAAVKAGKKCLVIEKRDHIGGNIYTEKNSFCWFVYTYLTVFFVFLFI